MRYKIVLLLFVFWILFAAPAGAQAQDPWDNYRPRTLKQIIEPHAKMPLDKEVRDARIQLLFTADFPCRVKVTYTGEKRAIPAKKKEFIAAWAKSR